jgi:hypothetical protein
VRREQERDEEEHRRHEDEREAYAVHADPVGGVQGGNPGDLLDLREPLSCHPTRPDEEGPEQGEPRGDDADGVRKAGRGATHKHQERRADEREKEHDGDEREHYKDLFLQT